MIRGTAPRSFADDGGGLGAAAGLPPSRMLLGNDGMLGMRGNGPASVSTGVAACAAAAPGAIGFERVACDGAGVATGATGIERVPCDAAAAAPGATGIARVAGDGAGNGSRPAGIARVPRDVDVVESGARGIERVPCDAAAPGAMGVARVACDGAGAASDAAGIERVACDDAEAVSDATGIERVACGGGGGGLAESRELEPGPEAPRGPRGRACVEVYLLGGWDLDGRRCTPVDSSGVTSMTAGGAALAGASPPRLAGTRPVLRRPVREPR